MERECIADWPYNLIEEILGHMVEEPLTKWQIEGLDYILERLKPREQDMIIARYRDEKTLKAIGESYGIGSERVRQIIARAVRKLCHPSLKIYILQDYKKVIANSEEKIQSLNLEIDRLTEEIIAKKAELYFLEDEITVKKEKNRLGVMSMSIENFADCCALSVRSFNCLRRAGLDTVGDVVELYNKTGFLGIRNLGAVSRNEIRGKLYAVGAIRD